MSEAKELRRKIERALPILNGLFDEWLAAAYKLGQEVGRDDIFSKRKLLDAIHLEIIRGLPVAKLDMYGSVKKSTRRLPA